MKILKQNDFQLTLIFDLGMKPIGGFRSDSGAPRQARFCTLQCTCGAIFETRVDIGKRAKSCRLCSSRSARISHGDSHSRLYKIWQQIYNRAGKLKEYLNITVDPAWKTYESFRQWALTAGYKNNLEIDRIDNTKGYSSTNCRWTTRNIQGRNTRKLFAHNTSGYRGVCYNKKNKTNSWMAYIKVNNKKIHLKYHPTAIDAAKAYDTYVILHNLEHTINGVLHEPLRSNGTAFNS